MKFGVCVGTDVEKIKFIKKAGFDYAEGNCRQIASLSKEQLDEIKAVGLPVFAANCFISIPVVGPEKNEAEISEYISKLFANASYLGTQILVFGSSAARRIPDGMSLEEGRREIIDFLKKFVVPCAEKYNIRIAIEPLRPQECNAVNTIDDGVYIAKEVNSPYVRVLADVAHMYYQDESMDKIITYKDWIIHAHTSNPQLPAEMNRKRIYPKENDGFNQNSFIDPLKEIGVESCSVEAEVIDFESDVTEARKILKG